MGYKGRVQSSVYLWLCVGSCNMECLEFLAAVFDEDSGIVVLEAMWIGIVVADVLEERVTLRRQEVSEVTLPLYVHGVVSQKVSIFSFVIVSSCIQQW